MDETPDTTEEILEPDFQVLANGIDESGRTREALAWLHFAIEYVHELGMATAYPPFTYRNVDGFETELQLDWTGITCSSISNERAVVVFDDSEQLVELHQVLVGD